MAPLAPASLSDKVSVFAIVAKSALVALAHYLSTPLRSGPRPNTLYKDVIYRAVSFQLASLNLSQERWIYPSTEQSYLDLAKKEAFQPDTLVLSSGSKAHWFGNKGAEKILVFFHGGGYVLPCSPGHFAWVRELTRGLSKSFSISTLVLNYTTAPEAQYPTQLKQAAELVHHLIEKEGRKPRDIIIAGDSAGGNLALALLSHILHPHPEVSTRIELEEPFRAAVLISPWVDFSINQSSFSRNERTDMLCTELGVRWSGAFMGSAAKDQYNQPVTANSSWFGQLDTAVGDILIWGGGGEVLIDSIDRIAKQLKDVHPNTDYIVEPNAGHEDFIFEKWIGYTQKAQGTQVIEEWISSRL